MSEGGEPAIGGAASLGMDGGSANNGATAAVSGAAGQAGASAEPSDSQSPHVVAVIPANGADGVTSDSIIKVTFSEPMDKASVQAAFQSASLGAVTFDWSANDTLIVTPAAPLVYAEGASVATTAKTYSFSVNTAAQDLAGNPLSKTFTSEFATLRKITKVAGRQSEWWSYSEGPSKFVTPPNNVTLGAGAPVGDIGSGATLNSMRVLFVFDIGGLPTDIVEFSSATLTLGACCSSGKPASLGALYVDHINLWPVDSTYFYLKPLDTPGVLADPPSQGNLTVSVKKALEDDYAHRLERGNRSEMRVGFATEMTDDNSADGYRLDEDNVGLSIAQISATFLIK